MKLLYKILTIGVVAGLMLTTACARVNGTTTPTNTPPAITQTYTPSPSNTPFPSNTPTFTPSPSLTPSPTASPTEIPFWMGSYIMTKINLEKETQMNKDFLVTPYV